MEDWKAELTLSETNWLETTDDLEQFFQERYEEVQSYLVLLKNVETAKQLGAPTFKGTGQIITASQSQILTSNLYLQLYNLVEATVTKCIDAVSEVVDAFALRPEDMPENMLREWVKSQARTNVEMGADKRLKAALRVCETLINRLPVGRFDLSVGGGGNWDDKAIEALCKRLGFQFALSTEAKRDAKRPLKNNLGSLKLVMDRRNGLAHGSLSFVDCGGEMLYEDMERLVTCVGIYLSELVDAFVYFLNFEIVERESAVVRDS
ncbi:MAE_28990/MAE_18760 family HEPN-like nuclease [Corynebacterium sp. HMSC05C01]|uniref:MAE_28990/MAE_18760 family HEPN-like nuclease n=1 Tax=Corynebacterium sp. HMSC05C01 TaxID=1581113 RepID=UPI00114C9A39|nr:MAE_28990/MAE_18760 family HEPN-like nuclease [Corynebacterium sp. HMSC05C01]